MRPFILLALVVTLCTVAGSQTQSPPTTSSAGNFWPPNSVEILSDTMGVDFGAYLQRMIASVRTNWHTLIPEKAKAPLLKRGNVAIDFVILKNGSVANARIAVSSGDADLDRAAHQAITVSTPFAPLPREFNGEYIALRCAFAYNPTPSSLTIAAGEWQGPKPADALLDAVHKTVENIAPKSHTVSGRIRDCGGAAAALLAKCAPDAIFAEPLDGLRLRAGDTVTAIAAENIGSDAVGGCGYAPKGSRLTGIVVRSSAKGKENGLSLLAVRFNGAMTSSNVTLPLNMMITDILPAPGTTAHLTVSGPLPNVGFNAIESEDASVFVEKGTGVRVGCIMAERAHTGTD